MAIQLPVKILVLFSLLTMIAEGPANAQQEIEKYLVEQKLVSADELKAYKDKEKAGDEYVRLMIRLMKGEKGDRKYRREMENEYKEELKKKEQNKDTLSILADILAISPKQPTYATVAIDTQANSPERTTIFKRNVNDSIQILALTSYALQLKLNGLISEHSFNILSRHIMKDYISDSSRLVEYAIGLRDKAISTAKPRLIALMDRLKELKILSQEKYQELMNKPVPDSGSQVLHIISYCGNILLSRNKGVVINGKEEFEQLISSLSKLTGIEVSNPSVKEIELIDNLPDYRSFRVIELYHQGKKISHEESGIITSGEEKNIYPLFHHELYKVFNTILADKNSLFRIHLITEKNPDYYIHKPWHAYILLSRDQSDGLYRHELVDISYEENIDPLSETKIHNAIELYKKAGLFNKITQRTIDSVLNEIKVKPVFRYNELISRFPSVSILSNERVPASNEQLIYQIKMMAELSNYFFDPKNIRIKDSAGKSWISFELNNKTYTDNLYDPWIDAWQIVNHPTFIELKENPFESLRISQHKKIFVYLPSKQMRMLEKEKVIGDW